MSRKKGGLTREEVAFLRSDRANPAIARIFDGSTLEELPVRASAYRAVASALKAERDALVEARLLDTVRQALGQEDRVETAAVAALRRENDMLRQQVANALALPASAVHSQGTGT